MTLLEAIQTAWERLKPDESGHFFVRRRAWHPRHCLRIPKSDDDPILDQDSEPLDHITVADCFGDDWYYLAKPPDYDPDADLFF